jgi:hypothetical protein
MSAWTPPSSANGCGYIPGRASDVNAERPPFSFWVMMGTLAIIVFGMFYVIARVVGGGVR